MNKKQYIQNFGHFNLLWEKEFFGLGYRMFSRISFGCAPLGQEYGFVDKEKGYLALKKAFKLGYIYFINLLELISSIQVHIMED